MLLVLLVSLVCVGVVGVVGAMYVELWGHQFGWVSAGRSCGVRYFVRSLYWFLVVRGGANKVFMSAIIFVSGPSELPSGN